MNVEYWAIVKIQCTDGKERLGINMEDESIEETIVERGLHYEYAAAIVKVKADELGLEVYDGENGDYDQTTY